jgi:hypothetical protein
MLNAVLKRNNDVSEKQALIMVMVLQLIVRQAPAA